MARNHNELVQEISYWKEAISSIDTIPLNPNHTYKDENDIYERLTEYVKDWTESVFGVYTNNDGELVNLPEEEEGKECKDWLQDVGGKMTPLSGDWYQVALKGDKQGAWISLPQMNQGDLDDVSKTMQTRDEIKNAVHSTFFPAYRALRDSFSKRSIFQWIFNHRQYTAERDALKVMTSLITSMTGYTKKELDAQYVQHQKDITPQEIADFSIEYSNREVHMNEPQETNDLFKDVKRNNQFFKVEKDGKVELMEGVTEDAFANERRYDDYFEDVMPTDEVLDIDYDEPIEDNVTAEERVNIYNNNEDIDAMCSQFMEAFKTTEENEESIWRAMHIHLYPELHKAATNFGMMYDAIAAANKGEKLKQEFDKLAKRSAKHMFEVAFNALGAEDAREIVQTVKGKEVREKVGGSLFGVQTLKYRIVVAQKITDVMLKNRTPIAFYPDLSSGEFTKGFNVLENTDTLYSFIKEKYPNKYGESEINTAMKLAKNEFGVMHHGEKQLTSYFFEIGYRPDPSHLQAEQKVLGNAQKMIAKGLIKDETIKTIVTENVNKWKQVRDMQKPGSSLKMQEIEKKWIETDKKLAETYKDYEAESTEKAVASALEQYKTQKNVQEKLKLDLNEPKAQVAPPVQQKPMEISAPKVEK